MNSFRLLNDEEEGTQVTVRGEGVVDVNNDYDQSREKVTTKFERVDRQRADDVDDDGDDDQAGRKRKTEQDWRVRLKMRLMRNKTRVCLIGTLLAVVFVLSAVLLGSGFFSDDELRLSPEEWCSECFRGDLDECGFVPVSYYPFSWNQTVRRNNKPQFNGNPG